MLWLHKVTGMTVVVAAFALAGCCGGENKSSTTSGGPTSSVTASWKVGDKVDVEWKGSWWQARILEVKGDKFKVHYLGWGTNWDELVPASRVRAPTATAQKGTGPE